MGDSGTLQCAGLLLLTSVVFEFQSTTMTLLRSLFRLWRSFMWMPFLNLVEADEEEKKREEEGRERRRGGRRGGTWWHP